MNKIILLISTILTLCLVSCNDYDNFDEPNATLTGRVVYKDNVIGVRTNAMKFELWQDGFGKNTAIDVYVAQDGTYSASLFSGHYKLVRKTGGPWLGEVTDTIRIDVFKNTVFDVPVTPYILLRNESYTVASGKITAKFTLDKIVETSDLSKVKIFLGKYKILDDKSNKDANIEFPATFGENAVTVDIPESLKSEKSLFIRIGAKSTMSDEYCFTQVETIALN